MTQIIYYQITIPSTDEIFLKNSLVQARRWVDRNIKHDGFVKYEYNDDIDWFAAYHEALGALMEYSPELAKKIDDKYKVQS